MVAAEEIIEMVNIKNPAKLSIKNPMMTDGIIRSPANANSFPEIKT